MSDSSSDKDRAGPLVRASSPTGEGWRGDEHKLQVQAASEAGLPATQVAVDLYTEGFKAGLQERDPADGAIVLRGRTVLKAEELERSLRPALRFLRIGPEAARARVFDGQFELRIAAHAAEASAAVQGAARTVILMWMAGGLLGWWMLSISRVATFLVWGITLLLGAWSLRRGLVSGRTMLAARLAVALGMLAHEEQLILPPAEGRGAAGGGSA
jgi:hypothetical protein